MPGGVYIDTFVLKVAVPGQKLQLEKRPLQGPDPSAAGKGSREAWWPEANNWVATAVYELSKLQPGNLVPGPALIESEYTTVVLPPGKQFRMDEYGIGLMEATV